MYFGGTLEDFLVFADGRVSISFHDEENVKPDELN